MDKPDRGNGSVYWGDNHTVITSETGLSFDDLRESGDEKEEPSYGPRFHKIGCSRYCPTVFGAILCLLAFLTPVAMIILPTVGIDGWLAAECTSSHCEGMLITMAIKMIVIFLTTCIIFFRHQSVTLPRVNVFKAVILLILTMVTFSFWLFYGVRIFQGRETDFGSILSVASSFADILLFLSFLAVVGLELRHLEPTYCLKIVRSPDGESRYFTVGRVSIQRAAAVVLQQYFKEFPYYNPFIESAIYKPKPSSSHSKGSSGGGSSSYKFYDIGGLGAPPSADIPQIQEKSSRAGSMVNGETNSVHVSTNNGGIERSERTRSSRFRRRGAGHNDRFYAEEDYDRRVKKRRARLIVATDDGFSHVRRLTAGQSENSCR